MTALETAHLPLVRKGHQANIRPNRAPISGARLGQLKKKGTSAD
jgi:hypothetical protein